MVKIGGFHPGDYTVSFYLPLEFIDLIYCGLGVIYFLYQFLPVVSFIAIIFKREPHTVIADL
jgi:hypothetical protein